MYTYICLYICADTHTREYTFTYSHLCTLPYTHAHATPPYLHRELRDTHTHTHTHTHTYTHTRVYTNTDTHTRIDTHIHTRAQSYTNTHTLTYNTLTPA